MLWRETHGSMRSPACLIMTCRLIRGLRRKSLVAEACLHRRTRTFRRKPAKIGIFTAYYNSSAYFDTHLACIRRNTRSPYDYYVMKNYSVASEAQAFDITVEKHGFPRPFYGVSAPLCCPLPHGDSLHRMVSLTDNDIIGLCDVDAYLIKDGWDQWVLHQLEAKELVAVIVYFDGRLMPLLAHPSFMAFRRSMLEQNSLDVRHGEGNDPAYKITRHLIRNSRFDARSVTPLVATSVEFANGTYTQDVFGLPTAGNPSHGFCTQYGDVLFHFWHSMNYAKAQDIIGHSGEVMVPHAVVRERVQFYNAKYGQA